ncbi:MAG: hypothetical protein HZB44_04845 [Actinobacteria bacterium]|nr:hypothetical protein [Actinomycetota bacterium]
MKRLPGSVSAIMALALFFIGGCSSSNSSTTSSVMQGYSISSQKPAEIETAAASTQSTPQAPSPSRTQPDTSESNSYKCETDCSGHEEGYLWAAEHHLTDPYECDGNSNSFIEGCQAFALAQVPEIEEGAYRDDSFHVYYEEGN